MFQNFVISIVILPILWAINVAGRGDRANDVRKMRAGWVAYAIIWFFLLYYLRFRWR